MANISLTARDEKFIAAMRNSAGAVGVLSAKLNIDLRNAFSEVNYVSEQFNRGIGQLGSRMKTAGMQMTTGLTLPLALASAGILRTFADVEKLKIGLDQYGVSLQDIKQIAKTPGLGIEEAGRSVQMLADARFNVDLSKKAVVEFGNALAAAGRGKEELEGVFRAFSQIKGKGKVQAEEINQIAERLPIIRQLMVDIFGTADTEKLQKMGITADDFLAKLTERLSEMPRVAGGFSNAIGNIGDALKIGAFEIGNIADKLFGFEAITTRISTAIEAATNWFKQLSPGIQSAIFAVAGLVAIAGPLLIVVGGITAAIPALIAGFSTLAVPIAAFAAGAALIISHWDIVKPYFAEIFESLSIIFNAIKAVVEDIWGNMANNIISSTGTLLKGLFDIFSIGLRAVAEVFRLFGGILTGDGEVMKLAVTNIFKSLWNGVISIFQSASTILINLVANLFDSFGLDKNAEKLRNFAKGFRSWTDTFKADLKSAKSDVISFSDTLKKLGDDAPVTPTNTDTPAGAEGGAGGKSHWISLVGQKLTNSAFSGNLKSNDLAAFAKKNSGAISGIIGADITKSATVLQERFNMLTDKMKEAFKNVGKVAILEGTAIIEEFNKTLNTLAADFLANAFDSIFSGGGMGGALKGLLTSLGSAIQQLGKQFLIANKVVEGLKAKFATKFGIPGAIAAIAAGGIIKGIANNIAIPALANGGLAYAPTLAMVGDNRNAGVDPEVIAPLSKLKGIIGGGGNGYIATTEIGFDKLLIALKRAERRQ